MSEKYDFSKISDQQKFEQLPQEEKGVIIGDAQEEMAEIHKKAHALAGEGERLTSRHYQNASEKIDSEKEKSEIILTPEQKSRYNIDKKTSALDMFEAENYLNKISFDSIIENIKFNVNYYEAEKKKGLFPQSLRFEHVNAFDKILGCYYALSKMPEKFSSIENIIRDSRNIYANSNGLINYFKHYSEIKSKDKEIEYSLKRSGIAEGTDLIFMQHLLMLKSLYEKEDIKFEEEIMTDENKKMITKATNDILRVMQEKFENRQEDMLKGWDGYGFWEENKFYFLLSNILVVYKKLFPKNQETEVDFFIKDQYEKLKAGSLKFKEEQKQKITEDRVVRNQINLSLLMLNYLNPKDNIINEKDAKEIKVTVEELLKSGLDDRNNVVNRRYDISNAMCYLGLIDDIKIMKNKI